MLPTNPNQSTPPSLASYFPQIASSFSDTQARTDDLSENNVQIGNGFITNLTIGNNNTANNHIYLAAADSKLLETLMLQHIFALQPNIAPLVNVDLAIEKLQKRYLKELKEDNEIKNALLDYVAPEGMGVYDSTRFDLKSKVQDFLNSNKKVLLLLGEAGSGKSTFNRDLAVSLWETYTQRGTIKNMLIPIFIGLSSLSGPDRNLVNAFFEKQGFSKEQIKELQSKHRFILILDGFDEIEHRQQEFYKENELSHWKGAKIIISSRPEYLGPNYQYKFHAPGERTALQEYRLAPFSEETIKLYIDRYSKAHPHALWSVERYKKALEEPGLKELASNPFLLKMMLSELPMLSQTRQEGNIKLTRLALYDQFVKSWFSRSQQRLNQILELGSKERQEFKDMEQAGFEDFGRDFSQKLALEMHHARQVITRYQPIAYAQWQENNTSSKVDWRRRLLGSKETSTVLMRLNAPLICHDKESGLGKEYQFIHKSLRDYFVARALWEELGADGRLNPSSWFNRLNIVNDPAVLSFLAERVRQVPKLETQLLNVVKRSKGGKGAKFKAGAANALTILVKAGVYLNRLDLSEINVQGADLSYGMFDQTRFERANLKEVKFRNAWLRRANFEKANLEKVDFGELPSLKMEGEIHDCCYSFRGDWFAVATSNKINLFYTETLELKFPLEGHTGKIWSIDFSSTSQFLASGSEDKKVILWNIERGEKKYELKGHKAGVLSVNFSGNNKYLASGSKDGQVNLWDVEKRIILHTFENCGCWVNGVNFSPNSALLAAGSSDGTVKIWRVKSKEELHTLKGHNSWGVNSVRFSPNNDLLASGSRDRTIKLWTVANGKVLHTLEGHNGWITSVNFSKDGKILASGSADKTVKIWGIKSGKELHTFEGHNGWVSSVNFSTDKKNSCFQGAILASGSYDNTVKLWKVERGETPHEFTGHGGWVSNASFSSNGKFLASGSEDGMVRLWTVEDKRVSTSHTFKGHSATVLSVAFSPDSKTLASGSEDTTVRLWDVENGVLLGKLGGHSDAVPSTGFSPCSQFLASGSKDGTVKIWDVKNKKELCSLEWYCNEVKSVSFSLDGKFLASGSHSGEVKIWDVDGWKEQYTFHEHRDEVRIVRFSPDSKLLASGSDDKTVRLWEINKEKKNSIFVGHDDEISSLNFSGNSLCLVSGSWDRTVKVWSIDAGKCATTYEGFVGMLGSIVWHESCESGVRMIAGSRGSSVHIWQINKKNGLDFGLNWTSSQNELMLADISGKPQGLDLMNARLLEQRQKISVRKKPWLNLLWEREDLLLTR
ncbi:MAG: WD40 repeat [Glomeribacter sp. 1016415]|nr:WD40 repeat [Glomeribacter sp. 1016415]